MENSDSKLTLLDALYLQRAYELAARGAGSTSPNPPVGAVIVRDGKAVGEGYHHRAGAAHAETRALHQAGARARGATAYVSLEPCPHFGRTPPCTQALIAAGITRVVAGTLDPTHNGRGAAELRERGVAVTVLDDPAARALIEVFARAGRVERPYVGLKMAMSLDGAVTTRPGVRERLGSEGEERYVRELRTLYDAVLVGAATVRTDDPQLTVRPPHDRSRPYVRIVACERESIDGARRIFGTVDGYDKTLVLAPAAAHARFDSLRGVADVIYVGDSRQSSLDLGKAMKALRERGIASVLCEGGPRLAASMLAGGLVDRVYWAIAPRFLQNERAVPVLAGADLAKLDLRVHFDRVEAIDGDVIISGSLDV